MIGRLGIFLTFLIGLGLTEAVDYNLLNALPICSDQTVIPGQLLTITSSKYPNFSSEQCKYTVRTYNNFKIVMQCQMGMGGTNTDGTCSTDDGMYFQADGSGYFYDGSTQRCELNRAYVANTTFNSITFAFYPKKTPGTFSCTFQSVQSQCDCGIGWSPRIVGGVHYAPNSVPSMVAIKDNKNQTFGGSIVSGNVILTAAHGLYRSGSWVLPSNLRIFVGCDDLSKAPQYDTGYCQEYAVDGYAVNGGFSPTSDLNDLALIFTTRILAMNRAVFPICLPQPTELYNKYDNQSLYLFGWGSTSFGGRPSNVLLGTQVTGFPLQQCTAVRPDLANNHNFVCTATTGHDSCQGDSGGPAIYKNPNYKRDFLAATIIDGGVCGGGAKDPGINLLTAPYVDWIKRTAGTSNFFCTYP